MTGYPLARNVTFFEDGLPIKTLVRENFLLIEQDGTLNVMYRDSEDTTRVIVTFAMGEDAGERMVMLSDRTPEGIPSYVPELIIDTFMPDRALVMAGMEVGDTLRGAIMVTLPGNSWKPSDN